MTCSPTYALRLRGGGFSFKTGIPVSISELSPCAPRFFCYRLSCALAQFFLQKVSSFFPDVDCSVDVTVVVLQTVLAKPLTHIQSLHLRMDRSAPGAYLARREPPADLHQPAAPIFEFVLKHPREHPPSVVVHGLAEPQRLRHALHVQVLDADQSYFCASCSDCLCRKSFLWFAVFSCSFAILIFCFR